MEVKSIRLAGDDNDQAREEQGRLLDAFLQRQAFDDVAEEAACTVLTEIRSGGEKAIFKYAKRFDGVSLQSETLAVTRAEIIAAREQLDPAAREAVQDAHKRIAAFAKAGMKEDWRMSSPRGGMLGEQYRPIQRVGVYVPGGAAPLASTALMSAPTVKSS
jgi:histidinol dehydrogenase